MLTEESKSGSKPVQKQEKNENYMSTLSTSTPMERITSSSDTEDSDNTERTCSPTTSVESSVLV